jgi:hypothetical protein
MAHIAITHRAAAPIRQTPEFSDESAYVFDRD